MILAIALAICLNPTPTNPCIYIEPNPTITQPGIQNMAGAPDIKRYMEHETKAIPIQPTPTSTTTTPQPTPSKPPTTYATTPRITPHPTQTPRQIPNGRGLRTNYTVQPGDCLSTIAQNYATNWQTLWAENPWILDPNLIWPGEMINIPDN